MFSYLKNILLSKKPFYYYTIDFEKNFLDKLSSEYNIKDDLTRSYCQYKCFKKIDHPIKHWMVYWFAFFTNPIYVVLLISRSTKPDFLYFDKQMLNPWIAQGCFVFPKNALLYVYGYT